MRSDSLLLTPASATHLSPPSFTPLHSLLKATESYRLGEARGRAAADFTAHPSVYGKKAQRSEPGEWGVGDCIRGDATAEDMAPDPSLGRSVTFGYRNAGFADPARRFGLPSVRTDVAPRLLSMATTMDFGNGTSAALLLGPCSYAELGVGEEDFLRPMAPARLRRLFQRIGTQMSDAEFACVYNHVRYVCVCVCVWCVMLHLPAPT